MNHQGTHMSQVGPFARTRQIGSRHTQPHIYINIHIRVKINIALCKYRYAQIQIYRECQVDRWGILTDLGMQCIVTTIHNVYYTCINPDKENLLFMNSSYLLIISFKSLPDWVSTHQSNCKPKDVLSFGHPVYSPLRPSKNPFHHGFHNL